MYSTHTSLILVHSPLLHGIAHGTAMHSAIVARASCKAECGPSWMDRPNTALDRSFKLYGPLWLAPSGQAWDICPGCSTHTLLILVHSPLLHGSSWYSHSAIVARASCKAECGPSWPNTALDRSFKLYGSLWLARSGQAWDICPGCKRLSLSSRYGCCIPQHQEGPHLPQYSLQRHPHICLLSGDWVRSYPGHCWALTKSLQQHTPPPPHHSPIWS